ncbi:MAG: NAD-dependent epimerase/dehydratase family protein [Sandaracinaceae bacterium]
MKVVVLGASGFIGGAVVRSLIDAGHTVRAAARDPEELDLPEHAERARAELGDPTSIADAASGMDVVVCAAGIVSPRAAKRALTWTHVAGAENLVNACKHAEVRRLVHVTCTDVTLHAGDRIHWDEDRPTTGYAFGDRARSLQLGEELILSTSGPELEAVSIRASWVWGPGDTSRLPGLLREARSGGIQLVGDGRTYFATTYIDHLAEAILAGLDAENAAGRPYHVVDPTFQHARDFFFALSEALGLPRPKESAPFSVSWPLARLRGKGPGGLTPDEMLQRGKSTLFDFSAACGKLAYDPKVSMEDGLRALAEWITAQGGIDAVASMEKQPPAAESVEAQVRAAGGD